MSRFCRGMLWAILIFAGLALMWASIVYGQAEIPAKEVFCSLFDRDQENSNFTVIYSLRLPRLGLALLAGSAFAVSGAILQGVLHNDLAEPGLIGVSSGGGLAGLAVMLYLPGYPALQLPAAAAAARFGIHVGIVEKLLFDQYPTQITVGSDCPIDNRKRRKRYRIGPDIFAAASVGVDFAGKVGHFHKHPRRTVHVEHGRKLPHNFIDPQSAA